MAQRIQGEGFAIDWRAVEVDKDVRSGVFDALEDTVADIARDAKADAPRDQGDYAAAFDSRGGKRSAFSSPAAFVTNDRAVDVGGEGGGPRHLAAMLEYGTSNMPAQPHIWPAYDKNKPKLNGRLEKVAGK